jgi:hypothetical protein
MNELNNTPGNQIPLRFAVLCNGTVFQQWQAEAIRLLLQQNHLLVLLIRDDRQPSKPGFLCKLVSYPWAKLFFNIYYRFFFHPSAKKNTDLSQELEGIETLGCTVIKKGHSEYFSREDIRTIRSYNLDFILRFGFNIIRGDILDAARHGVWSFHHDDESKYRGGPPGFWEIYHGDPVNAAILQRLTEKLDGGIILRKGYFKTIARSGSANLDQLLSETSKWTALVAGQVASGIPVDTEPSHTDAEVYRVPGNLEMLVFLARLLFNKIKFHCNELFCAEEWNIAMIDRPIRTILEPDPFEGRRPSWHPAPPAGTYYADPFMFTHNTRTHVVFEHYRYPELRAAVSLQEIENNSFMGQPITTLRSSGHLSYPYIIETGGSIFCIPESCLQKKVSLYQWDEQTREFILHKTILENIDAVDPTLVFHEGFWWLFLTLKGQSNTNLYLYYAEELTGEFSPHQHNPVKSDIRSSRPAGTPFIADGVLYRPAQDCSVTYGGKVALNRVSKLTPDEFEETVVKFISPFENTDYKKGLHTVSGYGDYTVIDGKRYRFNGRQFRSQLSRKLGIKRQQQ